jgi:hypothetical protein
MARIRNPFRRADQPALIAAAQNVELGNDKAVEAVLKRRQQWQKRAFELNEAVGEINFTVEENASLLGRLPIYAAEIPTEQDGRPERTDDSEVQQVVDDLGNYAQRADIQHDLGAQLQVTGECYLVGIAPRSNDDDFRYEIASIDEIDTEHTIKGGSSRKTVKLLGWNEDGSDLILDNPDDTFVRIWRRSLRKKQEATSHVRSILDAAEELLWWDAAAIAAAKSRLALAGLVGVPSNLELPPEADPRTSNGNQRFINHVLSVMMKTIGNPRDAAAAVPIVFSYPFNDQMRSGVEKIEWDRPQDELLDKRTDRALLRIAQGLNAPIETVTGIGNATHWSGGLIERGQFDKHVKPDAILMVNALTTAYLHPVLREMGKDVSKYIVWFDETPLILNQNQTRDTIRLVELGEASGRAARRVVGLSESDKPTDEEKEQLLEFMRAAKQGGFDKDALIEDPQRPEDVDDPDTLPPSQPEAPSKQRPVEPPVATRRRGAASANSTVSTNGHGHDILVAQLQVMADATIRRALEKAGNRLVTRARKNPAYKAAISGTKQELVASVLGREAVIKLGIDSLFDGCFDSVHQRLVALAHPHFDITTDFAPASASLTASIRESSAHFLFNAPTDDLLIESSTIRNVLGRLPKPKVTV